MGSSNRREADRGYDERVKVFSHSYESQRLNRRCDYVAMVLEILSLSGEGKPPIKAGNGCDSRSHDSVRKHSMYGHKRDGAKALGWPRKGQVIGKPVFTGGRVRCVRH